VTDEIIHTRPIPEPGPRYGLNVTAFEQDYRDLVLTCGFRGLGFAARHRKPGAPVIATAMTLDELAEVIDSQRDGS
jgi:hypothetical protein